jgi:hypothetical protein
MRKVTVAKRSRMVHPRLKHSLPISCDITNLTRSEIRLLYVLADPEMGDKTVLEKVKKANACRETYYRAIAKPLFKEAQRQIALAIITQNLIPLMNVGIKHALKGSYQHWSKLMEMGEMVTTTSEGANGEITIRFADPRVIPTLPIIDIVGE